MASNALIWELTKNYNSFLVKRRSLGVELSTDPFNLTNMNKQAASGKDWKITLSKGLAHERAIGINTSTAQGNKKKGTKVIFNVLIKKKKRNLTKKAKAPFRRSLNTITTVLPLKKGVTQAAKVYF